MPDKKKVQDIENSVAGIILAAQTFNPSIFNETWLTKNNIISSNEITGLRIFSHEVAQFSIDNIQVLIIPPRMQILFPMSEQECNYDLPAKIVSKTVDLLPQTPYQALGINFDYFITHPSDKDFNSYTRSLLGNGEYTLLNEFETPDVRFGRYFSKNYGGARLKLDIKPVIAGTDSKDILQFAFNFHFELTVLSSTEEIVSQIKKHLNEWSVFHKYSLKLLELGR